MHDALPKSGIADGTLHTISDPTLAQRMYGILRLKPGEILQVFNMHAVMVITLQHVASNKEIKFTINTLEPLRLLKPPIAILLPLLKRDALCDALYTCVEMGVNSVDLVITQKIHKPWYTDRECERLKSVMIAAAEQSKQFVLPGIRGPQSLAFILQQYASSKAYRMLFDPHGLPLFDHLKYMADHKPEQLVLAVGPEGDFTEQEKTLLDEAGFRQCALTETVLRAQQALAVGLGAVRSCTNR
jgi:16S rRNA (uracil1498-N3)-methyltransferase